MRIDMRIILEPQQDYDLMIYDGNPKVQYPIELNLTIEQAKALRDQITSRLRWGGLDKEPAVGEDA